jgi:hypothetical protein
MQLSMKVHYTELRLQFVNIFFYIVNKKESNFCKVIYVDYGNDGEADKNKFYILP